MDRVTEEYGTMWVIEYDTYFEYHYIGYVYGAELGEGYHPTKIYKVVKVVRRDK